MKVICAWCDLVMADVADDCDIKSHGICPSCIDRYFPSPAPSIYDGMCVDRLSECVDATCPYHATGVS